MRDLCPILLVEDDDVDIKLVRRAVKKLNIANPLQVATDGINALDLLNGNDCNPTVKQPCVILLDINMPRMNGLELLKIIRRNIKLKQSIVFVLTTSARNEDVQFCYEHSVAGYILKQDFDVFSNVLKEYCDINQFPA